MGAYEDALATLRRSEEITAGTHLDPDPANVAFIAMSLHRLDRAEDAQVALGQLREQCKNERFAWTMNVPGLLAEAEKLILGEKQ